MTLTMTGKIAMQCSVCEKCGEKIDVWNCPEEIKCKSCGAIYKCSAKELKDQFVEFTFDFVEFQCMHKTLSAQCPNSCPAPEMFCKDHVSDDEFKLARDTVTFYENRKLDAEEKIRKMEESKRIHLIQEISGTK